MGGAKIDRGCRARPLVAPEQMSKSARFRRACDASEPRCTSGPSSGCSSADQSSAKSVVSFLETYSFLELSRPKKKKEKGPRGMSFLGGPGRWERVSGTPSDHRDPTGPPQYLIPESSTPDFGLRVY